MQSALKAFRGGASVPHRKKTENCKTEIMNLPKKIVLPMLQHIGAPCNALVKKGDVVKVGQKIGDSEAFISSPVHSSVSGIVTDVKPMLYPGGFEVSSVEIETDGLQELFHEIKAPSGLDNKGIIKALRESGLVGLGGAGFPAAVKLSPPPDKKVDVLVINGAECEPYITSDYRELLENTQGILDGIKIVMELTGVKEAFVGIESNKPEAIKLFNSILKGSKDINVVNLRTRYPQGGEKQLIYAVTGRKVPAGKLPSDIGVLVHNINTVSFIANFLKTGIPLIKKKVTVDGVVVNSPKNIEVLIGTKLQDVFDFCGGFKEEPYKIIMGGPMMGVAQFSLENSVLKQTNALLALSKEEAGSGQESVCIRCGKCVNACPMNLLPLYINANANKGFIEETMKYNVNDCIECGCCSFVCPAKRHLVQSIRFAKAELRKLNQKKS